jgi:putative addiction module killer protein
VKGVEIYQTPSGREPFTEWMDSLRDGLGRSAILARITRARLDNLGDHKSVGQGVIEMRVKVGPGYRVYLGLHGQELIVLLSGGDKSSQSKDIALAREYWSEWRKS